MFHLLANLYGYCKRRTEKAATVVILGLNNAGKSTIASVLRDGRADTGTTPTVGFSKSVVPRDRGFDMTLFDLGGSANFRGVWKHYLAEASGLVFVFDAADHARLDEAAKAFAAIAANPLVAGKPVLLYANKQDVAGALTAAEVAERLGLAALLGEAAFRIEGCCALRAETVDPALVAGHRWLRDQLVARHAVLRARVQGDVAAQKAREAAEKEEKRKRIEVARAERERARREADAAAASDAASGAGVGRAEAAPAQDVAQPESEPAAAVWPVPLSASMSVELAGGIATAAADAGGAAQAAAEASDESSASSARWAAPAASGAGGGAATAGPVVSVSSSERVVVVMQQRGMDPQPAAIADASKVVV